MSTLLTLLMLPIMMSRLWDLQTLSSGVALPLQALRCPVTVLGALLVWFRLVVCPPTCLSSMLWVVLRVIMRLSGALRLVSTLLRVAIRVVPCGQLLRT